MQTPPKAAASQSRSLVTVAAIAILFVVTVLCYWPSLSGPFIFDDTPNLSDLGNRGGIHSVDAFLDFVSSGRSGPLGRPLSLASFALNGQDWPTDPLPFRITNLLIHLVNGLLVFLLSRSLLATRYDEETANRLGLACMALWMLHPLAASTTAYIIQRMTQLASLFVLAGLLCYMHGRKKLADQPRKGWPWIIGGMGLCGLLAVLSKETGVLLPLYALVIEVTIFSVVPLPGSHRRSMIALLCAPLLLIVGYLALTWDAMVTGFDYRPFSMTERLLTQGVVLVEYLRQVFLPQISGLGIIHDDFPVSTSLLSPVSTLFSLIIIVVLLAFAVARRKRWPLVAFWILWFFAGHSLEAGPLPLEIYFDHRNYLPLLGPIVAVCSLLPMLPGQLQRVAPIVFGLFLCFAAFLTWQSAKLWANEDLMMRVALVDHPDSLRAQQYVANRHVLARQYNTALEVQLAIAESRPDHLSTRLSILNLRCLTGTLSPDQVEATQAFLRSAVHDHQTIGYFAPLMNNAARGTCAAFGPDDFQETLGALLQSPVASRDGRLVGAVYYFKGLAFHEAGMTDAAIQALDRSYEAAPEIDIRMQQVVWLIAAGRPDDAEDYLELARQYLATRMSTRRLLAGDLAVLEQRIGQLRQQLPQ